LQQGSLVAYISPTVLVTPLQIAGLLLVEWKKLGDHRGFFAETFREDLLAKAGFHHRFVQENHSLSSQPGTLRGLHFQRPPHAQDKLIRVIRGAILDIAVDIRSGSPSFGQHLAVELSAANGLQLLVPKGFAHGFVTLEPDTEVVYKVSDYYAPDCDTGILWNDPALGIDWQLATEPILSAKDLTLPPLSALPPDLFPFADLPTPVRPTP
jgi:dTDP-4-dehydrorhamnose 3,5-epimerase